MLLLLRFILLLLLLLLRVVVLDKLLLLVVYKILILGFIVFLLAQVTFMAVIHKQGFTIIAWFKPVLTWIYI